MILKCWDEGTRCLPFRKGAFGAAHVGKLVFVRMRERKTFPLGGRWHGEAVTDEGKRRDFLGDNDKRGKLPTWYSCFSRQNPSVRQPLIRPSVRTGAPSPWGKVWCSASPQIPIYPAAEQNRYTQGFYGTSRFIKGAVRKVPQDSSQCRKALATKSIRNTSRKLRR